jgi:hypothetical protein
MKTAEAREALELSPGQSIEQALELSDLCKELGAAMERTLKQGGQRTRSRQYANNDR